MDRQRFAFRLATAFGLATAKADLCDSNGFPLQTHAERYAQKFRQQRGSDTESEPSRPNNLF